MPAGTYRLITGFDDGFNIHHKLSIEADTTINATGATLDGNGQDAVLAVRAKVKITGATITNGNGYSGGGITLIASDLTLINCKVVFNKAQVEGGGISIVDVDSSSTGGSLTLQNTIVSNNTAGRGGGISIQKLNTKRSSPIKFTNSLIADNTATSRNSKDGDGGGIYTNSAIDITGSTVSGNHAQNNGGGLYTRVEKTTITNSTISGNSAENREWLKE